LPEAVSQQLVMVGLTHIIAVSGYNLTIMVEIARRIFGKRSKFQTAAACVLLILSFLLITGNSPSIVRASIISLLGIGAWYYGRAMQPVALLLFAAALTVLANPVYLWGNVSWYLSFLAFFGVVVIAPLATKRLYTEKQPPILIKMIIESLAAEMMTLPYVLFIFGQMSTVGLLANILVAVFVPLAMLLCAIAGLAGMLLPALAGWLAWPAVLVLTYMLDMAGLLSRIPHAFIEGVPFSLAALLGTYASTGLVAWASHRHLRRARDSPQQSESATLPDMSGHSKWSTIKREKGAKDAARGAVFTKLGNAIAIAARAGTDPNTNFALRLTIDKARASNMPGVNIDRAIQRVADKNAAQLQELLYEGYGPGGVAILVEVATDNINRTYPEVRLAFSKHGGNIAEKGAVSFQFDHKGMVRVKGKGDDLMMQALEAGAEDVQEEGEDSVVYTAAADLAKVRDALRAAGLEIVEAGLTYIPNTTVEITNKETAGKIMRLMDALDEIDDVTDTHVNFDIPEELLDA
jgi:YebC/PmpR family DNA-binding regulatory protein